MHISTCAHTHMCHVSIMGCVWCLCVCACVVCIRVECVWVVYVCVHVWHVCGGGVWGVWVNMSVGPMVHV